VGIVTGIVIGLTVVFGGSSSGRHESLVASWVRKERLPSAAVPGANVFAKAGCMVCHTYAGSGHTALDAPDLTAIGLRRRGAAFQIRFLRCPSCVAPGSPMPPFDQLGTRRLRQLAVFLDDSKGIG
jgi:cbb3-type cytochrome oxidase cytochrome c subunit